MARTVAGRKPYDAVVHLAAWAYAHSNYIEGRLLLAGLKPADLTFREILCVVLALRVDGHPMADLDKALAAYGEALAQPLFPDESRFGPTREEWDARMATFPPAPMRDPTKPRPPRNQAVMDAHDRR